MAAVITLGEDEGMDGYGGEDEELRGCPVSVLCFRFWGCTKELQ